MTPAIQGSLFSPCFWPLATADGEIGAQRRDEPRLVPPLFKPGGLQTLTWSSARDKVLLSLFTMSPHPPRQRGSGSDGQGSSSEVAAWPQPSPQPGRLWVLASSQLFPAFPVSEQTPAPMSQVLGHCSSLLVAEARMDVEQGPDWARMLGTTPSSGI